MLKSIDSKITAVILAGGESSRMGRDKALLKMGDRTLLARTCAIATDVSDRVCVVTPWIEKYRSVLPPNCQLIREELVLPAKSNAPIIGFTQALHSVDTEWVLLLACDLPYLSSPQVKQWSEFLTTVLPTEIALLPRNLKGWEALSGFYRSQCLTSLEAYLQTGGMSFQGWLASQNVRELPISDRSCLFNCNTPEDWQKVIEKN